MPQVTGTMTALVTPFHDGDVDEKQLISLIERQLDAGIDGLVPCGTTGESPTLTVEETHRVIALTVETAKGRAAVFAGAGSNCTATTVHKSKAAVEAGADAVMIVSPYYNKPSQRGLYEHFGAVAQAVDREVMIYNIPGRTSIEVSVETLAKLGRDFANIRYVKHATGKVVDAAALSLESDLVIWSGDDPLTLPLMSIGAVGVVSVISNLAPQTVKKLTSAALSGDYAAAREVDRTLRKLADALLTLETNPIPIKTALGLKGLCSEEMRLPLVPLEKEQRNWLKELIEANPLD